MSQYGAYGYAQHGKDYRVHPRATTTRARSSASSAPSPTVRVLLQTPARRRSAARSSAGGPQARPGHDLLGRADAGSAASRCAASTGRDAQDLRLAAARDRARARCGSTARAQQRRRATAATAARWSSSRPRSARSRRSTPSASRTTSAASSAPRARRRGRPRRSRRRPSRRAPTRSPPAAAPDFDQYADTRSQMYRGVAAETPATDAAVARHARPGRHLRRQAGRHLLLLHLAAAAPRTSRTRSSARRRSRG